MDESVIKARINAILAIPFPTDYYRQIGVGNEILQGTVSILIKVYGSASPQVTTFLESVESFRKDSNWGNVCLICAGALRNLRAEFDEGLTGSLHKQMTGDVLSDFIQLARAVLDGGGNNAKNVAAVLAAAAYEDTIRRMGSAFAGIVGRDDLSKVIDGLKDKGILVAPQLGIALSYLSFRNHALHADWDKIDLAAVNSVLGFVEALLLKHFA